MKRVGGIDYFGILQEVIELKYVANSRSYKTVLFKYEWFDPIKGVSTHEQYKLVDVNQMKKYPKYDPFVLASQVM